MDKKKIAVIVAHPDDETLWAGGTLLSHPDWEPFILSLCRKNDPDRSPKFQKAIRFLNAKGLMADLDDGPMQIPQNLNQLSELVLKMLPAHTYDIIITHSPLGEYTRHLRHEEIGKTVLQLWLENKLRCDELLIFAYEDGNRMYCPKAQKQADLYFNLPHKLWQQKEHIMTDIYGFKRDSWEVKCCPKAEAFWIFSTKAAAIDWLKSNINHESTGSI